MWIRGTKYGVGFWYVCWGAKGVNYNLEAYKTLNGLAKWFANPTFKTLSIHRVGRVMFTEAGPVEKEFWGSREEFVKWAKNLVPYKFE